MGDKEKEEGKDRKEMGKQGRRKIERKNQGR